MNVLRNWMTESNGVNFCPWNFCGMVAILVMCYRMATMPVPDFQNFGMAIGAIIVAIAGKRFSERGEDKQCPPGS